MVVGFEGTEWGNAARRLRTYPLYSPRAIIDKPLHDRQCLPGLRATKGCDSHSGHQQAIEQVRKSRAGRVSGRAGVEQRFCGFTFPAHACTPEAVTDPVFTRPFHRATPDWETLP